MATENIEIVKGSTFQKTVIWEGSPLVYKAITAIDRNGPVRLTVTGHGVVSGMRAAIVGVRGSTELNSKHVPFWDEDMRTMLVIDANTVELNETPGSGVSPYKSGGYIVYRTPVDLTGYTARMKIKTSYGGSLVVGLVSPTDIVLSAIEKTISITVSATVTAALSLGRKVYDLELESPTGVVTKLLKGYVTISPEVTT